MLDAETDVGHLFAADLPEELIYVADYPPFFLFHNAAPPLVIHSHPVGKTYLAHQPNLFHIG